ncbi:DUF3291 domain-containing protein [Changchengzhania lutea]|uniref:DUF3291 domain-containing protein n=1 Tax=Changchengzhania lutea TaxID=2049305 RepID=UPI00115D585D|nr:DUF3291 domain-containing protein [Changchengzhania lutea]
MNEFHVAQVNIAKRLAPMEDPIMQDFVNNLGKINAIADISDGFVWRLKDDDEDEATDVFQDDTLIINMSVWKNMESLFNYVYNSGHIEVLKRKKEWFSKIKMTHMAFWYVPIGVEPTFQDAKQRLDYINKHGDTPYAFTFKTKFTPIDFTNYNPVL